MTTATCKVSHADGRTSTLEIEHGTSLLQAALNQGMAGFNGDCGGACQCATCHVYVDEAWQAHLDPVDDAEDAMLDCTTEPRRPSSRLACRVVMSPALCGLSVTLPLAQ